MTPGSEPRIVDHTGVIIKNPVPPQISGVETENEQNQKEGAPTRRSDKKLPNRFRKSS